MANLRDLPPELKIAVARALKESDSYGHRQADIKIAALAALSATDRFFHHVADPLLYQFGAARHPYLLCWATETGSLNVMRKILEAGPINPQIGIIRYNPYNEYVPWDSEVMSARERFRQVYRRDGRQFQRREEFFARFAENDPAEEYGPFSDESSFSEENHPNHQGFFLDGYDDSDDTDDTSSEEFSENASVADHYSAGEVSDGAEEPNDNTSLDGAHDHGGHGGDDTEDGDSADGDHGGLDDEAMFEEFEEVERETLGIIRYPDEDDYDEVDEHDVKGLYWFPVHIAARYGNLPALELLVEFGALLNVSSKGFCCQNYDMALYWEDWNESHPAWTPLHVALCHGRTEMVKYMLKKCPHIQERLLSYDEPPWSMLPVFISAMRHGYPELAEFSLEQLIDDATDADPDLSNATLLWRSFWETQKFHEALQILLRHGADIDHDLNEGHTLLMEACLYGNFEEAIALINAGANVKVILNHPGAATELDYAWDDLGHALPVPIRGCGVLDICCALAPILGRTTIPIARAPPSPEFAPELIRLLLVSEARNISGRSPIHIAASAHNSQALEVLLDSGLDPTSLDDEGFSALVRASRIESNYAPGLWLKEFAETISLLVDHLRERLVKGSEAYGTAVKKGPASAITAHGNGLGECFTDGDTALRNIMENPALEIFPSSKLARHAAALKLIAEGLADINTRDKFDRTTLSLFVAEGDAAAARQLVKCGARVERSSNKDDLASLWAGFVKNDQRRSSDIQDTYQLLCTLDVEKRILRDPQFLAFAMYGQRQALVNLMVPSIQPDTLTLSGGVIWKQLSDKQDAIVASEDEDSQLAAEDESSLKFLRDGWTLLHVAIENNFVVVAEKLLSSLGASANEPTPDGQTPLHLSIKGRGMADDPMIHLLFEYGADPHLVVSATFKSAVDHAIQRGSYWVIPRLLRDHPVRGNLKAQSNLYLHSVVSNQIQGIPTASRIALLPLIQAGADINATDSNGDTPLSFLIKEILRLHSRKEFHGWRASVTSTMIPTLIRAGTRPSVCNNEGKSVLAMLDMVKYHKDELSGLRGLLRSTLLYDVMLYRKSIGM